MARMTFSAFKPAFVPHPFGRHISRVPQLVQGVFFLFLFHVHVRCAVSDFVIVAATAAAASVIAIVSRRVVLPLLLLLL